MSRKNNQNKQQLKQLLEKEGTLTLYGRGSINLNYKLDLEMKKNNVVAWRIYNPYSKAFYPTYTNDYETIADKFIEEEWSLI